MLRLDTPPARLRTTTLLEGVSYVSLLFIAMPLKYLADQPLAVRVVGSLHGFLFVLMCWLLLRGLLVRKRSLRWAALIFVASLLPFGTFAIDRRLQAEDQDWRAGAPSRP